MKQPKNYCIFFYYPSVQKVNKSVEYNLWNIIFESYIPRVTQSGSKAV